MATCRRYVDFPPMFGPVTSRIRRSGERSQSLGMNGSSRRRRSTSGWRPSTIERRGVLRELADAPNDSKPSGDLREARRDVELRDDGRRGRDPLPRLRQLRQQRRVEPRLDLADPVLGAEDLLLELLQGGRDEALRVGQRLLADPVGRHLLPVRVRPTSSEYPKTRLKRTRTLEMPERLRSSASIASSALCASLRSSRSWSSSASKPSRMTPPADGEDRRLRREGGLDGATQSAVSGTRSQSARKRPAVRPAAASRTRGMAFSPAPRAATSRGPAVPTATRAKRRSRSPTRLELGLEAFRRVAGG